MTAAAQGGAAPAPGADAAAAIAGRAWTALAALLAAGALPGWWLPAATIDWQPGLAASEPWRAWTAAWVHWSPLHLGANLLATAVVGTFGRAARLPKAAALAWAIAWPLTQAGLLLRPELAHYGGLSGVLHAGVAVAAVWLMATASGRPRWVGAAVAAGLVTKIAFEQPWGPALRRGGGWDIAVAPFAHVSGAVAGAVCAAVALAWHSSRPAASRHGRLLSSPGDPAAKASPADRSPRGRNGICPIEPTSDDSLQPPVEVRRGQREL